jgi:hypothetical protein
MYPSTFLNNTGGRQQLHPAPSSRFEQCLHNFISMIPRVLFRTVLGCEGHTLAACTRLSRRRVDCFGRCTKSNLLDFPKSSKSSSLRFLRNRCVICISVAPYNQSHRRWNCCCCVLPRPISRFEVHYLPTPLRLPLGHHRRLCSSVLVHLTAVLASPQYCDVLLCGGEDSYILSTP